MAMREVPMLQSALQSSSLPKPGSNETHASTGIANLTFAKNKFP
jgi:hypothetical protein